MHLQKGILLAAVVLLVLAAAIVLSSREEPEARAAEGEGTRILAINVGKADSLLIWAEDKIYLVDTGTAQSWGAVAAALSSMKVTRLDGVFLTHTDKDHMGGMASLAGSAIQVDAWYASAMFTGIKQEKHPTVLAAARHNLQAVWLKAGDRVEVSADAVFEVLGPITLDSENENNNSLVMVLKTPDGNILLTGDMEFDEEAALLNAGTIPACAILKVSHHGDNDATSPEFVATVAPKVALISTSSAEEPDTPSRDVLKEMTRVGAQVAVTQDAQGGMMAILKGGQASVQAVSWELPALDESVQLAGLDAKADILTLRNTGSQTVSLAGWYVYSTKGDEIFFFPRDASLAPGATALLGSQGSDQDCDWRFDDKNVWSDKKADEAVLYDPYGRVAAMLGNGLPGE